MNIILGVRSSGLRIGPDKRSIPTRTAPKHHGRFHVSAGDVIFHERFEGHLDRFSAGETIVLNLNLCTDCKIPPGLARVTDVDGLGRIAEKDQNEALTYLMTSATRCNAGAFDWEDELCRALLGDGSVQLTEWGFREVFAVTPESFRARARARRACLLIAPNRTIEA